uniref:Large ribosomal subunit protein uL24c n=1 Tax=Apophlaea sinclairii TaxID=212746 RepID=A0A1C9CBU5_9FLOR|nr:ribosomal protein L24 [Apophlaea sinclairii]AOM65868.1 ribosomal protein L24 [Apophlaea sinclairii]
MRKNYAKHKIHVKTGDTVKIIAGTNKGEVGKITQVLYKSSKVIIKNINMSTKHIKANEKVNNGQRIKIEVPIHSSNVMLYSNKSKTASRFNYQIISKIKQRILKKTQEIIT